MPTILYLRSQTSPWAPPAGERSAALPNGTGVTAAVLTEDMSLLLERGSSQVSATRVGPASTGHHDGYFGRFTSPPLAAQTFTGEVYGVAPFIAGAEDTAFANAQIAIGSIYVYRPSDDTVVGYLKDSHSGQGGAELALAEEGRDLTANTASSTTVTSEEGDVLVFEVWLHWQHGNLGNRVKTIWWDGATDVVNGVATSDAASYLLLEHDVVWMQPAFQMLGVGR